MAIAHCTSLVASEGLQSILLREVPVGLTQTKKEVGTITFVP